MEQEFQFDQWGEFLSGYAPLPYGEGRYLVGVDIQAAVVKQRLSLVRLTALLAILVAFSLSLLASWWLANRLTSRLQMLASRCRAIVDGSAGPQAQVRVGDEVDELTDALEAVAQQLSESRKKVSLIEEELKHARHDLEVKVDQRTKALTMLNEKLRHEIADREKAEQALALAARSDPLTGLLNRRAMAEHIGCQVAHCRRYKTPFAVLLSDLDHFKEVNDSYGHDVGDQVLCRVAQRLQQQCRQQDFVSRWGGEEFLILLPSTGVEGAQVVAEKLHNVINQDLLPTEKREVALTMSVGAAVCRQGQTLEDCIKAADLALYQAKRLGRNRVVTL